MKKLIIISTFLFSMSAWSTPVRLGDSIEYQIEISGVRTSQTTEVTAYDPNEDLYTVITEIFVDGQSADRIEEKAPEEQLFNHETAIAILNNCTDIQGTIEYLSIDNKSFKTCRLELNPIETAQLLREIAPYGFQTPTAIAWFGDFPINGIGKVMSQGLLMTASKFHWAN